MREEELETVSTDKSRRIVLGRVVERMELGKWKGGHKMCFV